MTPKVEPPNPIAAIIFSELFNNQGMTVVGKVEKIIPRLEHLIAQEANKAVERLEKAIHDATVERRHDPISGESIDLINKAELLQALTADKEQA